MEFLHQYFTLFQNVHFNVCRFVKHKIQKSEQCFLENQLKKLETNTNYIKNLEYTDCRNKLDKIYKQKINDMRIRSKCDWYKYGEKSSKFFLNFEKS